MLSRLLTGIFPRILPAPLQLAQLRARIAHGEAINPTQAEEMVRQLALEATPIFAFQESAAGSEEDDLRFAFVARDDRNPRLFHLFRCGAFQTLATKSQRNRLHTVYSGANLNTALTMPRNHNQRYLAMTGDDAVILMDVFDIPTSQPAYAKAG